MQNLKSEIKNMEWLNWINLSKKIKKVEKKKKILSLNAWRIYSAFNFRDSKKKNEITNSFIFVIFFFFFLVNF